MTDTPANDVATVIEDQAVKHSCPDCGVLHGAKSLLPATRRIKVGIEKICPDCLGPGHSSLGTDANKFRCLLRQYAKDLGKSMTGKDFQEVTDMVFKDPLDLGVLADWWKNHPGIKLAESDTVVRPYEMVVEVDKAGGVTTKGRKKKEATNLKDAAALGETIPDVLPDIPILIEGDAQTLVPRIEDAQEFNNAEDKSVIKAIAEVTGQDFADTVSTDTLEAVDSSKLVTVVTQESGADKEKVKKLMKEMRRKQH